ncbi:MAG: amidohydrolase [Leptospiraceae bacterium]|nr:amidohydrolase [Leptospiraceae bacterium]
MKAKLQISEERRNELISHRREIHKHPELKFEEMKTANFIKDHLNKLGFGFQDNIAKTGVVALIDSKIPGPTVIVRGDMDALPITEENSVEYKSKYEGLMHACGHDAHIAILLGFASELKENISNILPLGKVLLVFQPAEEGGAGVDLMVEEGILEKYKVDGAFALHVWNHIEVGKVGVVKGAMMASVDEFKILIRGVSGHGAMPQHAIDPILVGSHIVTAIQSIVSRNVDPLDSCVVTIGSFHGGNAFNVIPETVELTGTVRTYSKSLHDQFPGKLEILVKGIAQSFGATVEIEYRKIDKPTVNHPKMAEIVKIAAKNILGEDSVTEENVRTMGGEDFSAFLDKVPGCYFFIGSRNSEKGFTYPHHSSKFDFDEDALSIGLCVMKETVKTYMLQEKSHFT